MRFISMVAIAGLLALAGCEQAPPPDDSPEFGEAFQDLPLPADGKVITRSGSRDALQIVLESQASQEAVVEMYRTGLTRAPWRLVSDTRDSTGTIVLYAEGRRPLWVRVSPSDVGRTRIELNGAVPGRDSAYVRDREAAADTINTMRSRTIPRSGE